MEKEKNCTDCRHFGNCWLRRHKKDNKPCEDFELEEWDKDDAE